VAGEVFRQVWYLAVADASGRTHGQEGILREALKGAAYVALGWMAIFEPENALMRERPANADTRNLRGHEEVRHRRKRRSGLSAIVKAVGRDRAAAITSKMISARIFLLFPCSPV